MGCIIYLLIDIMYTYMYVKVFTKEKQEDYLSPYLYFFNLCSFISLLLKRFVKIKNFILWGG